MSDAFDTSTSRFQFEYGPVFFLGGLFCASCSILWSGLPLVGAGDSPSGWSLVLWALILVAPVALGVLVFVRRNKGPRPYPWGVYFLGVVIAWATLGNLFYRDAVADYVQRRDFDEALWRAAASAPVGESQHEVRYHMVRDLMDSGELDGRTRDQVAELLGPAERDSWWNEESDVAYLLGPERGLVCIDSAWLVIEFDERNRVKRYVISGD